MTVIVPDSLFIYERNGKLRPYQKTAIDKFLKDYGRSLDMEISNHDLRRTGGRMMHRAGVPIEEIARVLRHSDTKVTMHYLGLDRDDMNKAMEQYHQYQKNVICPKTGIFDVSQRNGGRIGI
jgi:integrase